MHPLNPVFSGMGELQVSFISKNRRSFTLFVGFSDASADRMWSSRYSANTLSKEEVSWGTFNFKKSCLQLSPNTGMCTFVSVTRDVPNIGFHGFHLLIYLSLSFLLYPFPLTHSPRCTAEFRSPIVQRQRTQVLKDSCPEFLYQGSKKLGSQVRDLLSKEDPENQRNWRCMLENVSPHTAQVLDMWKLASSQNQILGVTGLPCLEYCSLPYFYLCPCRRCAKILKIVKCLSWYPGKEMFISWPHVPMIYICHCCHCVLSTAGPLGVSEEDLRTKIRKDRKVFSILHSQWKGIAVTIVSRVRKDFPKGRCKMKTNCLHWFILGRRPSALKTWND